MTNIQYLHQVYIALAAVFFLVKVSDVKEFMYSMLGENGKVSSKRVCVFLIVGTLCYMAYEKYIDHWVFCLMGILALVFSGLATVPQVLQLLNSAKGLITTTTLSENKVEIKKESPSDPVEVKQG